MCVQKLSSDGSVGSTSISTITRDKIFLKNTNYRSYPEWNTIKGCIEDIQNELKINNLYIFCEDMNNNKDGKNKIIKNYLALDYDAVYKLSSKKIYHLYENYDIDEKVKLFIDIDIKEYPDDINKDEYFDNIIDDSINLFIDKLKEKDIFNPQIIILKSSSENKLSSHVIFNDVIFEDIYHMKHFLSDLDSKLIKYDIIDMSVYRKGCFRLLWNSKLNKNINLEYYDGKNYTYTTDKQLFYDCLLRNIPQEYNLIKVDLPESKKIIKRTKTLKKSELFTDKENNNKIYDVGLIKRYMNIIDIKRADKYNKWIEIGTIIHNCNHTKDGFNLWNEWSKQSYKYSDEYELIYFWNKFKFSHKSIASLKYIAKDDNPIEYEKLEFSIDEPKFKSIKFNHPYLLDQEVNKNIKKNNTLLTKYNKTVKNNKTINEFMDNHLDNWMKNEIKTLAIKSSYGTGKTSIIKRILNKYKFKTILFISYRQSLTNELEHVFKEFKVKSYLNNAYNADKFICQIDSLDNLIKNNLSESEENYIEYDLIILDEIESLLNHFRSSTIKDKENTFNIMKNILYNSNKILALDGDFGNRAYDYITYFGESIILENEHKNNLKHFIFTNNKDKFDEDINDSLKFLNNIVIVCMSSKLATMYYNKYKDKYKTILHSSKSDDILKEKLKDVNKLWKEYQLIIYTPCIEAGIDFNIEHIDKIYTILSDKSTSQRGLFQMIARCRKVNENNIMVYTNNLPFYENGCFYNYDETKHYICEIHNEYLKPIQKYDKEKDKFVYKYDFNLYAQILTHNETENFNKNRNLFISYFINLIKNKGHSYEYSDIKTAKYKQIDKNNILKEELKETTDINKEEFNILLKKQTNITATREDKIQIERYLFKKHWKVQHLTEDFINKYYGKSQALYNLRCLINKNNNDKIEVDNIKYDDIIIKEKTKIINDVIDKMGFDLENIDRKLSRQIFEENIIKVINESILFKNHEKTSPLFELNKSIINKLIKKHTNKSFMGFINSLLDNYGINIKWERKCSSKYINKNKTSFYNYYYYCSYIKDINKFV
jgi:hypothetical protein